MLPRAMPDWFVTTPTGIPAARRRASAGTALGTGRTRAGSAQYGTSWISVPSRSNSTAAGRAAFVTLHWFPDADHANPSPPNYYSPCQLLLFVIGFLPDRRGLPHVHAWPCLQRVLV